MTGKQILIVEDEKPIRDMIAFGLRRAGFTVSEAEDCSEARSRIADSRPDLLLVDWMLPDQSGLELTRAIKRNKETQDLPVILLTARAEEQDKVAGLEGGRVGHFREGLFGGAVAVPHGVFAALFVVGDELHRTGRPARPAGIGGIRAMVWVTMIRVSPELPCLSRSQRSINSSRAASRVSVGCTMPRSP